MNVSFFYLYGSLGLLATLLVGLAVRRAQGREALLSAALSAPYALASTLFVPEYWNPVWFAHFLTGLEDLIFSFATGGIAWLLATWTIRARIDLHIRWRRVLLRYVVCSTGGLFVCLALHAHGLAIMDAAILSVLLLGAALLGMDRGMWPLALSGSLRFGVFYTLFLGLAFTASPEFVRQWNLEKLWGPRVVNVPAEEIVWALAYGAVFPLLMAYAFDGRRVEDECTKGRVTVRAGGSHECGGDVRGIQAS